VLNILTASGSANSFNEKWGSYKSPCSCHDWFPGDGPYPLKYLPSAQKLEEPKVMAT